MRFLIITTHIGCFNCKVCPQDAFISAYKGVKDLTLDFFEKILYNTPKDVIIHFSGMSEPFLNPYCLELIKLAIKTHPIQIFTTTRNCTDSDISWIIENSNKINRIVIHLPDNNNFTLLDEYQIKNYSRLKSINNIQFMTMDTNGVPHIKLQHIFTQLNKFETDSRCGLIYDSQFIFNKVICSKSPTYNGWSVMPNGDTYLCVNDWRLEYKIGNLINQQYEQINTSAPLRLIRKLNNTLGTIQKKTPCWRCCYIRSLV